VDVYIYIGVLECLPACSHVTNQKTDINDFVAVRTSNHRRTSLKDTRIKTVVPEDMSKLYKAGEVCNGRLYLLASEKRNLED
jgi:hypothetical protein